MLSNRRQAFKVATAAFAAIPTAPWHGLPQAEAAVVSSMALLSVPGARQPGETSDTKRLQRAIDEAVTRGGGTVFIPAGRYVSGTLQLRSRVSLWLDNGVVLAMSPNNKEFSPPEKLPFDAGANVATSDFHFALLAGDGAEHIAVYGEGVIECERGVKGGGPKPIALRRCRYVSLHGLTLQNAQNYNISLLGCDQVDIDGVTVLSGHADGIDPDCCRHVRIANCYIESVDDSLCLKASGSLGERGATEFVTVTNCVLRTASIHFKCGTESCGDFRNITISDCVFEGGAGMRHGNPGLAFYTVDEGTIENVVATGITMQDVGTPIAIIRGDRDRCATGKGPGMLRSIRISDVIASGAKLPSVIAGMPAFPVEDVHLTSISITTSAVHESFRAPSDVPEAPKAYPQPTMFGKLPAAALFLRHVSRAQVNDVSITASSEGSGWEICADDVAELHLRIAHAIANAAPRVWLNNVRTSFLHHVMTKPSSAVVCQVSGKETTNLFLQGEGAVDWRKQLNRSADVPSAAVFSRDAVQQSKSS